jgi:hypothetical protein
MEDENGSRFPVIFLLGTVSLAAVAAWLGFSAISYSTNDVGAVGTQLLNLVFIALVIERAVEVYVSNQFGQEDLRLRRKIRLVLAKIKILEDGVNYQTVQVANVGAEAMPITSIDDAQKALDDARIELINARTAAQPALDKLYIKKRSTAAAIAVVIGLVVAAAGVRIFADLVLTDGKTLEDVIDDNLQRGIFSGADILITALLLAGGADGIHQIMKRFVLIDKDLKV